MLVERVLNHTQRDGSNDIVKGVPNRHTFGEFEDVSGIKMPTRLDGADVSVELNPALDPRLFTTPPDGVADAEAWRETVGRFPNLSEKSRDTARLGDLEAVEVVLADAKQSGDVNYARALIAHRTEPGQNAAYVVELHQGIRPELGEEVFREMVSSFRLLKRAPSLP